MNNWTDFDELGAVLIAVLIIGGTVALYILSAVMPGEVFVPNELKAVAAAILAAYGFRIQKKTADNKELVKQSSENNSSK
jgi:hypothetical protein